MLDPSPLSTRILNSAASALDRVVVRAIQTRNRRAESPAATLSHDERMVRLAEIRGHYGAPHLVDDPDTYFTPPPKVSPALRRIGGDIVDATWPSTSVPFHEGVRDVYLGHEPNRTAHARIYSSKRGSSARPAIILIHGYLSGSWAIEERTWPIEWMRRIGFDVAMMVLPFHALRGRPGPPPFPGADPRFTNEGFRQAIADLRVLLALLRDRGASSVGVMGMSLGGYTTSLFGTLEDGLSFAVPIIPLASIADFARDQGRLGSGPQSVLQHRALEEANWVVSPFARKSRLSPERVLVVGARADGITPISHAERIAAHFEAELLTFTGGHLMQLWRRNAFRAARQLWRRLGVV